MKLRMALRALEWLLPCRDCGRLFCTKVDGWTFAATYKGRIRLCRRCYAMLFASTEQTTHDTGDNHP